MGVIEVWTQHELTDDLNNITGESLTLAQRQIYSDLRTVFSGAGRKTVTTAHFANFKQSVMSLVCDVIANREIASLSSRLRATDGPLFAHSASVAYLSVLLGLELENYIITERTRLNSKDARDFTGLGLAGMLHDIGKTVGNAALAETHECAHDRENPDATERPGGYDDHPRVGYDMLEQCRTPPATRQAVLMHHQRWNGSGWPAPTNDAKNDGRPPAGNTIHIFSRIVAVANTLDNLMTSLPDGAPPALALNALASQRFDGWFDPVVRRAALRAVPPFAIGSRVTLSDGTDAVVTSPNRDDPIKPTVRPLIKDGETHMIDLANDPDTRTISAVGAVDTSHIRYTVPPANAPHSSNAAA
jgi:HD-GYP domain-containing protein (c-di-GMP phosphodiesterase class II)